MLRNKIFIISLSISLFFGSFFTAKFTNNFPFNPQILTITSAISVILFALPSFYGLIKSVNIKRGITIILILGMYALMIEAICILTGFPYGYFTYGDKLGYKIFDLVPWTVFFAWSPLVIGSYALADRIVETRLIASLQNYAPHLKILLSTLLLVAIDLILDPAAVYLGFWTYQSPGFYYGVPFTNYLGWIFSGIIGSTIMFGFCKHLENLNIKYSALSYYLTVIFWTGVCFWSGMVLPTIIATILATFCFKSLRKIFTSSQAQTVDN